MLEVSIEGIAEELEDAATLLAAGGDHRPDAFTPTLSALATGSLGDMTVDHDVSNRLFCLIVRRLDPRPRQKQKVVVRVPPAKPIRQGPGLQPRGWTPDRLKKPAPNPLHRVGEPDSRHLLGPMPRVKQLTDPEQELLAPASQGLVGVFG